MATRILITSIINPQALDTGFGVEVQCLAIDVTSSPVKKTVFNVGGILLPESNPTTWKNTIKQEVVNMAINLGFSDASVSRTLSPDFS